MKTKNNLLASTLFLSVVILFSPFVSRAQDELDVVNVDSQVEIIEAGEVVSVDDVESDVFKNQEVGFGVEVKKLFSNTESGEIAKKINIEFELASKSDIQPEVVYGLEIFSKNKEGEVILDRKFFNEKHTIFPNKSQKINIGYDFSQLIVQNQSIDLVGVNLLIGVGTQVFRNINIVENLNPHVFSEKNALLFFDKERKVASVKDCYFEKKAKNDLLKNVLRKESGQNTLNCEVVNYSKDSVDVLQLILTKDGVLGSEKKTFMVSNSNESGAISFNVGDIGDGRYSISFINKNNAPFSFMRMPIILNGDLKDRIKNVQISGLDFGKDNNVFIYIDQIVGSNFDPNKKWGGSAEIKFVSGNNVCGSSKGEGTQELKNNYETIELPFKFEKECSGGTLAVKIFDNSGKEIDSASFEIKDNEKKTEATVVDLIAKTKIGVKNKIIYAVIFIILILVISGIVVLIIKKRRGQILFLLIVVCSTFFLGSKTFAAVPSIPSGMAINTMRVTSSIANDFVDFSFGAKIKDGNVTVYANAIPQGGSTGIVVSAATYVKASFGSGHWYPIAAQPQFPTFNTYGPCSFLSPNYSGGEICEKEIILPEKITTSGSYYLTMQACIFEQVTTTCRTAILPIDYINNSAVEDVVDNSLRSYPPKITGPSNVFVGEANTFEVGPSDIFRLGPPRTSVDTNIYYQLQFGSNGPIYQIPSRSSFSGEKGVYNIKFTGTGVAHLKARTCLDQNNLCTSWSEDFLVNIIERPIATPVIMSGPKTVSADTNKAYAYTVSGMTLSGYDKSTFEIKSDAPGFLNGQACDPTKNSTFSVNGWLPYSSSPTVADINYYFDNTTSIGNYYCFPRFSTGQIVNLYARVRSPNGYSYSAWSEPYPVKITNVGPSMPTIVGAANAYAGQSYPFIVKDSVDPDGDKIKYRIVYRNLTERDACIAKSWLLPSGDFDYEGFHACYTISTTSFDESDNFGNTPKSVNYSKVFNSIGKYSVIAWAIDTKDSQSHPSYHYVNVTAPPATLDINISANPSFIAGGSAPFNSIINASRVATSTATGLMEYKFDCNNDGIPEQTRSSVDPNSPQSYVCQFATVGTYTVSVTATQQGVSMQKTTAVSIMDSICGDGVKNGSEACDDGGENGDCPKTCSNACTVNTCSSPRGYDNWREVSP